MTNESVPEPFSAYMTYVECSNPEESMWVGLPHHNPIQPVVGRGYERYDVEVNIMPLRRAPAS